MPMQAQETMTKIKTKMLESHPICMHCIYIYIDRSFKITNKQISEMNSACQTSSGGSVSSAGILLHMEPFCGEA